MFETGEYVKRLGTAMAESSKAKSVCPGTGCTNPKGRFGLGGGGVCWGGCYNLFIFFFSSPSESFCDRGKFTAVLPKYRNFQGKKVRPAVVN